VPGDREVDLRRLEAAVFPATVEMVTAEDFADRPDLVRGYVGPQGLTGVRYLADPRVAPGTAWVTGANRVDVHARDVVCGRDFTVDGYVDVAEVREGDPCPRCGAALAAGRGIEIGQIFQLGRHFTDLFEVDVLGQDGTPVRPEMGCYGIGITRAAAAVAEQTHDGAGLCWPASIAPADVHLVAAGRGGGPAEVAERVAGELAAAGLDVLYDDRTGVSAGVKFTDAELIGVPAIVVVGRRASEGVVEVRDRRTGERRDVPIPELLTVLRR
jgi:prolyl-tRNA synthetase